jgi:hypothetical protein
MPKLGKSSHLRLTLTNLHLDLFTANTPSRLAKHMDDVQEDLSHSNGYGQPIKGFGNGAEGIGPTLCLFTIGVD